MMIQGQCFLNMSAEEEQSGIRHPTNFDGMPSKNFFVGYNLDE